MFHISEINNVVLQLLLLLLLPLLPLGNTENYQSAVVLFSSPSFFLRLHLLLMLVFRFLFR